MHSPSDQKLLAVRNLCLAGPRGLPILNDVSFDVAPGEIVALVGESGSGKTMAARAVMQLLPTGVQRTSGHILFENQDVLSMPNKAIRKLRGARIGMVFQEPMVSLNPARTIGAQLIEGLILHEKISADAAMKRAAEMLEQVQIDDPHGCLRAFPHQFSGGMRQRIMLASVMLLKPKLLIADEPTTALDTLTQREVLKVMVELTRTYETAVLLITHNLGLVAQYADSVVVLEGGKLVENGSVHDVLTTPKQAYTKALINALPQREAERPPVPVDAPLIAANDVAVSFPGASSLFSSATSRRAVNGVSLVVNPGETVAVVGGSGSGKTTLGRALIGLLPLAAGDVRFRNIAMSGASKAEKRDFRLSCQLVFQDPYSSLDPRQKIIDIVAEPLEHVANMTRAERLERATEMLAEVGLAGFGSRYPHALSGGQRQRVAIARAVVRNPAFVVADEPVSALDMTIQKQVLDLFRRLQERHGFACLFISHDLGAVSRIADRILVMHQGEIVEQGSVADILDRPQHDYTKALLEAAPTLKIKELI